MKYFLRISLVLLILATSNAFAAENKIKTGSQVKFDYTLYVGEKVIDTSNGKKPLEYTQGKNMIIPSLEKRMEGLKKGDKKTFIIPPEEAYGVVNQKNIVDFPKANFANNVVPKEGMTINLNTKDGKTVRGIITEVQEDTVTLNLNHPLAGKELKFDIEIISVN